MDQKLVLLYQAADSKYGIEIAIVGGMGRALSELYAARRTDPELSHLRIYRCPDNSTERLWIIPDPALIRPVDMTPITEEELFTLLDTKEDP